LKPGLTGVPEEEMVWAEGESGSDGVTLKEGEGIEEFGTGEGDGAFSARKRRAMKNVTIATTIEPMMINILRVECRCRRQQWDWTSETFTGLVVELVEVNGVM
jgi:hypothetical protein